MGSGRRGGGRGGRMGGVGRGLCEWAGEGVLFKRMRGDV